MNYDIPKLAKRLNFVRPKDAEYLEFVLAAGRTFIVTRLRDRPSRVQIGLPTPGRTIQATGETIERCTKTFEGWSDYSPRLVEIKPDSTVIVHRGGSKQ